MRKSEFVFLMAVGVGCVGCGGSGGGGVASVNPFVGTYAGEYVDQNGNAGQFQLTVMQTGSVSGTYSNATATFNLISGHVDGSGKGVVTIPNGTASIQLGQSGQATTTLSINPTRTNNPNALAVFVSKIIYLPLGNSFTGGYAGTIHDTTLNTTAALAVVINAAGTVSGSEVVNLNGVPTLTSISGTVSSTGALSCVSQSNQVTITGTVTKGNNVYGPIQLSNGDAGELSLTPSTSNAPPP